MAPSERHYCYVLRSGDGKRTYAGYTVDPRRRLRQHNGEIKGGAWSTSSARASSFCRGGDERGAGATIGGARGASGARGAEGRWTFAFVVACDMFDRHMALSFEWHLKHLKQQRRRLPHNKKCRVSHRPEGMVRGLPMRIACLAQAMLHPKFIMSCTPTIEIYAADDLVDDIWAAVFSSADSDGDRGNVCVLPLSDFLGGTYV